MSRGGLAACFPACFSASAQPRPVEHVIYPQVGRQDAHTGTNALSLVADNPEPDFTVILGDNVASRVAFRGTHHTHLAKAGESAIPALLNLLPLFLTGWALMQGAGELPSAPGLQNIQNNLPFLPPCARPGAGCVQGGIARVRPSRRSGTDLLVLPLPLRLCLLGFQLDAWRVRVAGPPVGRRRNIRSFFFCK